MSSVLVLSLLFVALLNQQITGQTLLVPSSSTDVPVSNSREPVTVGSIFATIVHNIKKVVQLRSGKPMDAPVDSLENVTKSSDNEEGLLVVYPGKNKSDPIELSVTISNITLVNDTFTENQALNASEPLSESKSTGSEVSIGKDALTITTTAPKKAAAIANTKVQTSPWPHFADSLGAKPIDNQSNEALKSAKNEKADEKIILVDSKIKSDDLQVMNHYDSEVLQPENNTALPINDVFSNAVFSEDLNSSKSLNETEVFSKTQVIQSSDHFQGVTVAPSEIVTTSIKLPKVSANEVKMAASVVSNSKHVDTTVTTANLTSSPNNTVSLAPITEISGNTSNVLGVTGKPQKSQTSVLSLERKTAVASVQFVTGTSRWPTVKTTPKAMIVSDSPALPETVRKNDYLVQTIPYTTPETIEDPVRSTQCLLQPVTSLSAMESSNVVTLYLKGPKTWTILETSQFCHFLTGIVSEAIKESAETERFDESVTVVFLNDEADQHKLSFFVWNSEGEVIPGSLVKEVTERNSELLKSETATELRDVVLYELYREESVWDNPVLATALIAAVITVCVVAVGSLTALVCWHRYKKRYHGEWVVNNKGEKLDAWYYDNSAFFGAEEKEVGGSYMHQSLGLSDGRSPSSHSSNGEQGWLVPREMMEMVEKGQLKSTH